MGDLWRQNWLRSTLAEPWESRETPQGLQEGGRPWNKNMDVLKLIQCFWNLSQTNTKAKSGERPQVKKVVGGGRNCLLSEKTINYFKRLSMSCPSDVSLFSQKLHRVYILGKTILLYQKLLSQRKKNGTKIKGPFFLLLCNWLCTCLRRGLSTQ